ncbi:HAMP domain-containing histidine kinase [Clostridium gasigenes]|uniref:sensor histidine kinase n=1 Tax=Clostridium gasigenes TaxID=94869 RepID=UPI001C0D19C6|nr:HAMP domain-containing sensor histidine kinase [Clostridium gasigenes]MBU3135449.1 HAMP domain-containing histidine kinase [Clostridium gasigenes]
MKISIKIKSSIFLALLLLLTVSMLSVLVLQGIKKNQQIQYENYLVGQAKTTNMYIKQIYYMNSTENFNDFLQNNGQLISNELESLNDMNIILYDMSGEKLYHNLPVANGIDFRDSLGYALDGTVAYQMDGDIIDYMTPLYIEGNQAGVIQFRYSIKESIDFYNKIKSLFISIGISIFILSFIVAYFYLNQFANAILRLKKDALNIKLGHYNEVIPLKRNDELGDLSEGIYYMTSQIENNISEMKLEQNNLKLAVKKLNHLEKQQKTFIGNISHEFKTPLTVIRAYVDLLDMYPDDPNLMIDAKINIRKETQRLYQMVEKILQLSSLEKYDFEMETEKLDIKEIIEDICCRMKGKAQKFNISLASNLKSTFILADKESLILIFINLIDNAIKYNTSEGKIFINSYTQNKNLFIQISDTGIGIPKDLREKVFESFYTVNKDRSKEYGGTGLGLSLVKKLVEKQKGTISLLDTEIQGTTFLISFPIL